MLTHDNIIFQCGQKQACCGYHGKDVYLHVAPWYHVGGLVSALAMVMVGARHEFLDARQGFDAGEVLDVMQRKTCTSFIAVPTMLRDLVSCWEHKGGGKVLLSVKRVLVGAGGLGQGDAARVKRMLPRAAVLTAYGMTEACSSMSYMDIGDSSEDKGGDPFHSDDVVGENAYVGKVPRGIRMGVLSHQGTVLDEGRGELLTSGRHVFSMYYSPGSQRRQPEHFVLDFRDGTVWFRTGDMGYVRGDQLWLSGRLKDIIKTGGENVHAAEVERVLGSLGGVMECSVFAVPDIRWGEAVAAALVIDNREESWTELMRGRDRVLVMGSMASSSTTTEAVEYERIKAYCRERGLAPFKVPKVILVMDGQKSALPKNATGKVIKRGVQDMVLALLARVETPQRLANHPVQNQHKTWQYRAKL
jgi:acyl-activating enzyme 14